MPAATDELLAQKVLSDRCETYRKSLLRQIEAHQDTSRRLKTATAYQSLTRDTLLERMNDCVSPEDFHDGATVEHIAIDVSGWSDDTDLDRKVSIDVPDAVPGGVLQLQFTLIGYGGGIATYEVVRKY